MLPLRDARPPRRTPVVTAAILLVCAAAFGVEMLVLATEGDTGLERFLEAWGLTPATFLAAVRAGDWLSRPVADLVTHMFLHGSWLHLFGNALFLWIFGPNLEDRLGRPLFAAFYLAGGIVAALAHVAVDPTGELPMIGASGAISAVLGGYMVLFPRARVQSLVFLVFYYALVEVPSVLVLGFWFLLQLIDGMAALGLTAEVGAGIAFWAHIGGFVAGVLMALPLRRLRRPPADDAVVAAPLPSIYPLPDPGPPPPPPPR